MVVRAWKACLPATHHRAHRIGCTITLYLWWTKAGEEWLKGRTERAGRKGEQARWARGPPPQAQPVVEGGRNGPETLSSAKMMATISHCWHKKRCPRVRGLPS